MQRYEGQATAAAAQSRWLTFLAKSQDPTHRPVARSAPRAERILTAS
jgi:hypothetical protein